MKPLSILLLLLVAGCTEKQIDPPILAAMERMRIKGEAIKDSTHSEKWDCHRWFCLASKDCLPLYRALPDSIRSKSSCYDIQ